MPNHKKHHGRKSVEMKGVPYTGIPRPGFTPLGEMTEKVLSTIGLPGVGKQLREMQEGTHNPFDDPFSQHIQGKMHVGPCETCEHKKIPDGGWCYMFKEKMDNCHQWRKDVRSSETEPE